MTAPIEVDIEGRRVRLTNLDKVLYPSGFTKAEVVDYYARIAPIAVPHLAGRCITFRRFPDGTDADGFFEKRCAQHRPDWMQTALGPGDRRGGIHYCRIEETAAMVWAANLAAIELHAPMALANDLATPRALVFDFDPGPDTGVSECCQVALGVAAVLDSVGLRAWCKTSGSKGMQMYVPLNTPGATHEGAANFALAVGQVMERQFAQRHVNAARRHHRDGQRRPAGQGLRRLEPERSPQDHHCAVLAASTAGTDRVNAADVG